MKKIAIIGAGLAGLISAILLNRRGFSVTLYEKKSFPFHRVCGEYISNEVVPFLKSEKLYPEAYSPPIINKLQLTNVKGKLAEIPLDLGGFGISRYVYDYFLYNIAKSEGVEIFENTPVQSVKFQDRDFEITLGNGSTATYPIVIGAFGKRSKLDMLLERSFVKKRSPFIGVKYHIKTDFLVDTIALYNFPGGYCGLSRIEDGKYNLCYLALRDELRSVGNIPQMEKEVLSQNPYLRAIFENAEMIFDKPEVINEISFERKNLVEDHILMAGDAAGLITPLCGNGMAMAIHSAKILSDIIARYWVTDDFDRFGLEFNYMNTWNETFAKRLWVGRKSQNLFGSHFTSNVAVGIVKYLPTFAKRIVSATHGKPF